ncbi:P27 family phage terminase small subunit [Sphingomonas sp. G124]|uniref:P27 family phage terminase small subunit n=1 Tax=Sphingomonas cremea TaxID=2904799 RepID=A0A9X1TXT4_9SPHN|nr:P27 family phage terminase small subunit [Sphingomonas cremea]MCF2514433.1 P27 family phage terminase small subunit [Sphingomonas cremea]
MAQRGRRPKPTHLKLVTGTARKQRLNPHEPQPDPALPDPPDFVVEDPVALGEYRRAGEQLVRMGVVSDLDLAVLSAYSASFALWVSTEKLIAQMAANDPTTSGRMIKTTNGNIVQNPLVGVARRAKADTIRYAVELGLTPASRSRVDGHGGHGSDPASRFFS